VALAACGRVDDPADEGAQQSMPPADETSSESQDLNSRGQHCHGVCYRTGYTRQVCNYSITHDCRAWVVNRCHNLGMSFVDAYWSYWGCG
jgi:hypothetical protein